MSPPWPSFVALGALLLLAPEEGLRAQTGREPEPASRSNTELQGHLARGTGALERLQLELAEQSFRTALALEPRHLDALVGLSHVEQLKGNSVAALELAREAQALGPTDPNLAVLLGRQLAQVRALEEALEAFSRARTLGSRHPDAFILPALLLRDANRWEEALELLEEGFRAGVREPVLIEQFGLLLLDQQQGERAGALARLGLEEHPDHPGLLLVAGLAMAKEADQKERAVESLTRALELGATPEARIRLELGSLLLDLGKSDDAIRALKRAAALAPRSSEAYYRLATAYRLAGDTDRAQTALERFEELQSADDEVDWKDKKIAIALNEVQRLAATNQLEQALANVDEVLSETEDDRALALRAKILFSSNRTEEALSDLQRARTLMPTRVEYHYLEAGFLRTLGRPSEAEKAARQATALDPELAGAHSMLAFLLTEKGEHEEAVSKYERALALGADSAALRLSYAKSLAELGRTAESEEQKREAQSLQSP